MGDQTKLFEIEGPMCRGCPWRADCGAMFGDLACRAMWKDKDSGGGQILHPGFPVTAQFLDSVGGPGFEEIVAKSVEVPRLPDFIPPIRMRRELRGQLVEPIYTIRVDQVLGTRAKPLSAAQIRGMVGLGEEQQIVLLLFGKDKYLERLWNRREQFLPELAAGGFALIVAPSYSAWLPRPRPEYFWAAKRSMIIFQRLQKLGAAAIPRMTWTVPFDAERNALWANRNPAVSHVGLDLTTYRKGGYRRQLDLLRSFDEATSRRLRFLVNGPSRFDEVRQLLETMGGDRVHVTNSRAIARDAVPGTSYGERVETERLIVIAARRALADEAGGVLPRALAA